MAHWRILALIFILAAAGCGVQPGSQFANVPIGRQSAMRPGHHHRGSSATLSVAVHPSQVLASVSPLILGTGMAVWYNITLPGIASALSTTGFEATRWPGGKAANWYHWKTNTSGPGQCRGNPNSHSTFDNFMHDVAIP